MPDRWRRLGAVLERPLGEDLLLVPVDAAGVADLTAVLRLEGPVARWLWARLAEPADLDALTAEVAGHFEVGPDEARKDVEEFLRDLAGRGMVGPA